MGSERNFEPLRQAREALGQMGDYLSFRVRQDKRLKLQTLLEHEGSELPKDTWAKLRFEQGLIESYEVNYREAIAVWDILGPMQFDEPDASGLSDRGLYKTLSAYETAIEFYTQTLEQDDLTLGVALGLLNQPIEAIAAFDRAIRASHSLPSAWYNKAVALRKLGRTAEAIAAFDAALDVDPDAVRLHYGRAMLLCDLNRHGKAAADWDAVLSAQPARLDALYARGLSLTYLGQSREAIAAIGAVLNLAPVHQDMLQSQGHAFYKLRRYRDAVEAYAVALEFQQAYRSAGSGDISYGKFVCRQLSQLKALLSPETPPEPSLETPPEIPLAAESGASEDSDGNPFDRSTLRSSETPELPLLVEPIELETAVGEVGELDAPPTESTAGDYEALYNQGNALLRQGRYEAAIATYDAVLSMQPDYRSAIYNKACGYALWGKAERALEQLEVAIALHPEYGEKARTDEDLSSLREDPRFEALTN
ncbi:MAG: tetratricopeptide repeat protein [Elainellaceae cyanobacterium]